MGLLILLEWVRFPLGTPRTHRLSFSHSITEKKIRCQRLLGRGGWVSESRFFHGSIPEGGTLPLPFPFSFSFAVAVVNG